MKQLSEAQLSALRSARDHDESRYKRPSSLSAIEKSRRANGGFMRVRISLLRHGFIDWRNQITEAGLTAVNDRS